MSTFRVIGAIFLVAFALLFYSHTETADAHISGSNHLICSYGTTPEVDIIQADIRTHLKSGAVPTGAFDGYTYNDPPADPLGLVHPTEDPGTRVLYRIIPEPTGASYTVQQYITDDSTLSCNYDLECKDSCDAPLESGSCNDSCDITLQNASCPQYNASKNYVVKTGDSDTVVRWDDGSANTLVTPNPVPQTLTHTYLDAGKYDVIVRCGSQVCHKRYHVVCQDGGGGTTPTPLPTTAGGAPSCASPLVCSHPCSCDTGSAAYVNAGCDNTSSSASYVEGYGANQGTSDGAACSPGLICCKRSTASSGVWFKTKDADFHEKGGVANSIPVNAAAFNGDDTGSCNPDDGSARNCHVVNKSGVLSSQGGLNVGMSVANYSKWSFGDTTYTLSSQFTPDSFIQYIKSKKETVIITDPEDVEPNKINYLLGAETVFEIDNNGMQGKTPFILLIDNGDLRFDLNSSFNPSNKPMVIVVDGTIEFKSNISEVNGIFFADNFDFAYDIDDGSFTTNTFLLNGNIISLNDSECTEKRKRTDKTKPTCFFTFDFINQYLPTRHLFSIRTYTRNAF